jgi:hydrogenase nickel incorporation protein HypA/HybF
MHEASIALNILERAEEIAIKHSASKINSISVVVGALSGIVPESLLFAFDAIKLHTLAENCTLEIIKVPIKINCYDCKKELALNDIFLACPLCGSINIEVLEGRELMIKEIEVD